MTTNPDLYPTQFHHYLTRNLTYVLGLVQAAGPVLDEELRGQALHTLRYALQAPMVWPLACDLLLTLAPKMEQGGQREHWIPYLQAALHQSEIQHDSAAAGECHFQLALLHRLLSQFTAAYNHLQAALAHFTALDARRDQARVLNELAWLEHLQHRYVDASQHIEEALALLGEDDTERGMCYRVQGMIAIDHGQWQQAEDLHKKALHIFKSQGNQRRIAWGNQNLANALRGQRKFEQAIQYYKLALDMLYKLADIYNSGIVLLNLGIAYYQYGAVDDAIICYTRAGKIFHTMNSKLFLAKLHTDLGLAHLTQLHYIEAENAFAISIELFQELDDEAWRLNAVDGLAMTYLAQQNYIAAAEILEKAYHALPKIANTPNYSYLSQSIQQHLQDAHRGQSQA